MLERRTAKRWTKRYASAVAVSFLAMGGRVALDPLWGDTSHPFILFAPIFIAAWLGGLGPGMVATALCTCAAYVLWLPPGHAITLPHLGEAVGLVLFAAIGLMVSYVVASMQDARAAAVAQRNRAERLQRAHEELLAIVAHDLRNPLNVVAVIAAGLRTRKYGLSGLACQRLDAIERAVDRANRLIMDLLDATTIETGKLTVSLRAEDPALIVREAIDAVSASAQSGGVRLTSDVRALESVYCDRERILQVLANLLGNALKFTTAGGAVTVAVRSEPQGLVFSVRDTGAGIHAEDLPHVLERYFSRGHGGTGLGLYLANGIVRAHGGELAVESAVGHGTTVSFRLLRAGGPERPVPPGSACVDLARDPSATP